MTEIRSYRAVFELERRLYRLDRLRLNPGGVPVRGVVYFLALLTITLAAERLPLLSVVAHWLPWYLVDAAVPGASAGLLTMVKIEGRPFHVAGQALARHRVHSRRLVGWRGPHPGTAGVCSERSPCWAPSEIVLLPNGSDRTMRRLRYRGPGAVLVSVGHRREGSRAQSGSSRTRRIRRPRVRLRETDFDAGEVVVVLARGTHMRTG
ncbi:MAG TPA: hypothetical protein VEJ23_06790 [Solirubrobacteraceae bacterium]|nr:hypothetical protein [Solirubrobacteraceae bacterium]